VSFGTWGFKSPFAHQHHRWSRQRCALSYGYVKSPVKIWLDGMASLRVRQRRDGSSYTAVLYALDGNQSPGRMRRPRVEEASPAICAS
jgi:hypothetical protein